MDAGIYIRMIGAMAMVLGLLLILFFCLKKWGRVVQGRGGGVIEVLETRMVMPRRHICLVRVGTRVMVLASSEKGFDYLGDIEQEDTQVSVPEIIETKRGAESV